MSDGWRHIEAGAPTAQPTNVAYRLSRVAPAEPLGGVWLDCGCAGGGYTTALLRYGATRAVGVEAEQERLWSAPRTGSVSFASAAAEHLPFKDSSFDGVLLNEVLEHVADERRTLGEILRVLRPGGRLALMSPNRWFPFEGHGMLVGAKRFDFPIPLLPWLPLRLARQVMLARTYWPGELVGLVRDAGFKLEHCQSLFPVFEAFPWLPSGMIPPYREMIPRLEHFPLTRRFGNSTLILARKPTSNASIRGESTRYDERAAATALELER